MENERRLIQIHGRGAASNPENRFERLVVEPDPEHLEELAGSGEAPRMETRYYRDSTRTIIATNDSPDVGFTHSVNPYRGCSNGCVYCLSGETPILMGDGSARPLAALEVGDVVYGTERRPHGRRYVKTVVLAKWDTRKPAYRLRLADGTELVASGDHRFLTERGWKFVMGTDRGSDRRPPLTPSDELLGTGRFASGAPQDDEYGRGYLRGILRGDALLASHADARVGRTHGDIHPLRLALVDPEGLDRAQRLLEIHGVPTRRRLLREATENRRGLWAIGTGAHAAVERTRRLLAWPARPNASWSAGFLAGMFDAAGSVSSGILRIVSSDRAIVARTATALRHLGFRFRLETRRRESGKPLRAVRILGGLREHLRFFHLVDPAIRRKTDLEGRALESPADLRVVRIEPLGEMPLVDITTGTGDFIADGVVSHNCFARPFHEYLGLSAGLDFETRIFVKTDAPALLRKELASPRHEPVPLAMSGVTDPYQPVETRLRITRGCLEVMVEARNPVVIITKRHTVTRDADLLAELAARQGAAVYLSITTLDDALQRAMEPRASSPSRRLAALEALSRAGIPTGVMVAPVIPGLTDHELPAILEAAAAAGARSAGFVPLRLPHAVADLFQEWLDLHYPERKEKVLGRVRGMRGGKLYDARWGERMRGEGPYAEQIRALFHVTARKLGLNRDRAELSTAHFRRPEYRTPTREERAGQLGLF